MCILCHPFSFVTMPSCSTFVASVIIIILLHGFSCATPLPEKPGTNDIIRKSSSLGKHGGGSRLRAGSELEDENGMFELRSFRQSSRDEAIPKGHNAADDEEAKNEWGHRTVASVEKNSHSTSPRKETYILEDLINSIGGFFGFKKKRVHASKTESPESYHAHRRANKAGITTANQEKDEREEELDRRTDGSFESRTENVPVSAEVRENSGGSDVLSREKSGAEEEEESTRVLIEAHGARNTAESKDEDDRLSDADLLEMVRLFRRLFSSAEKALKEQPMRVASQRASSSNRASGRTSQLQDSDHDEEEDGSNDEALNKWGIHGQSTGSSVVHKTNEELPDVHVALAHAESLNRRRDAERQAKFAVQHGTNEEVSPRLRERSHYSSRVRGRGDLRTMEESPADMEVERGIRDVLKSAPSYGARKRLLRHREREGVGKEKTLTEWLVDGLESML